MLKAHAGAIRAHGADCRFLNERASCVSQVALERRLVAKSGFGSLRL
jgi:hypothetical protein